MPHDADARKYLPPVGIVHPVGKDQGAGPLRFGVLHRETDLRHAVGHLVERRDDFPAHAEIHGQPRRDLPVVHEVKSVLRLAETLRIALNAVIRTVHRAEQEAGERVARAGQLAGQVGLPGAEGKRAGIGQSTVVIEVALVLVAECENCGSREAR